MSEDLSNEQEAINSIYGEHTFEKATDQGSHQYLLAMPQQNTTLRLLFPPCYPEEPPQILGTVTTGQSSQKGYGTKVLAHARGAIDHVFIPGAVCIFDLLHELDRNSGCNPLFKHDHSPLDGAALIHDEDISLSNIASQASGLSSAVPPPEWTMSSTITLKKSVFVARACSVISQSAPKTALEHLLANNKRVARATHNITAYRVRRPISSAADASRREIIYQDCDDDGETAAGGRLLHLLQVMDLWDVFVVVSRWYGGVQLGPDRFRLISQVAREALVEGGWSKGGKPGDKESHESHWHRHD